MNRSAPLLVALLAPAILTAQTAAEQFRTGRAAYDAKQADVAVQAFEKAVALSDSNADYHIWLARALGLQSEHASMLRVPFIAKHFKAEWERAVQLAPGNLAAREGLFEVYLGPKFFGGDLVKAREQADAISKISPVRGYVAYQNIEHHGKDPSEIAEADARAAAAAFPDSITAVSPLVTVLISRGRTDEGFALIDAFVGRHPYDLNGLFVFGRASALTGKELDRGEAALRTVLAAPSVGTDSTLPLPANTRFRLGDILVKKGRTAEAKTEYEAALRLNPLLEGARTALRKCCG
jgi:tetratricopeptide (TPR) repeat protein